MRTLEQIELDIQIVKYDIQRLREMGSPISVALDDLDELYVERRIAMAECENK